MADIEKAKAVATDHSAPFDSFDHPEAIQPNNFLAITMRWIWLVPS